MGGWSSKPRKGMGTNLSVPNLLGFFPDHQLHTQQDETQGILTTVPAAPPPASTNRQSGRQPTPLSPQQTLQHPRVRALNLPAGGSSSGTVSPAQNTVSAI
uniref:Truncated large S protein n=1 Tax=Hepatitis B virus TaxID=10407 RepID=D3TIS1_HBV|nr:truncated large S protein [Hepatitis B virus]